MSINIDRCATRAVDLFRPRGWTVMGEPATQENMRALIADLVERVNEQYVPVSDYVFISTNRIHVQKMHFPEEGIVGPEVYIKIGCEYDDE